MNNVDKLYELLDQLEAAREAGNDPSLVELCRDCPELLKELQRHVQRLQKIDDMIDPTTAQSNSTKRGLPIRCPHCYAVNTVSPDSTETEVACRGCGSHFNLANLAQQTRVAPPLTSVGHFELVERIGFGGFGAVWKARDTRLDRTVAVKIPRRGQLTPGEVEGVLGEARAAAQLNHPNIVAIHEVGLHDDIVYIVSDFVRGISLADRMSTGGAMGFRESVEVSIQIADALHHAHEAGVVHRDVKPGNVMIDDNGTAHLMDFGLANRYVDDITVTTDGQILGTPAYMSPEQALGEGRSADRRCDIYSLGVMLFELTTGELPFRGNVRMIIHQIINSDPPPPRTLNRNLPADLQTITLKCLEKAPARRYQTAAECRDDLRRLLAGEPINARPVTNMERRWRWCKRNPMIAIPSSLAVILLLVVALVATTGYVRTSEALREKEQAAATSAQMATFLIALFRSPDPIRFDDSDNLFVRKQSPSDASLTAEQLLERGTRRIDTDLSGQPEVQAAMLETMGNAFWGLGLYERARELLEKALDLRMNVLSRDDEAIAQTAHDLARAQHYSAKYDEAHQSFEMALSLRTKLFGREHLKTAATIEGIALLLGTTEQHAQAEELLREVIEIRRRLKGRSYPGVALAYSELAAMQLDQNREKEARESLLQTALILEDFAGNASDAGKLIRDYQNGLASKDPTESAQLLRSTLEGTKSYLGDRHPFIAWVLFDYASALARSDDLDGAGKAIDEAISIANDTVGLRHPKVLSVRDAHVNILRRQGKFIEAQVELDALLTDAREVYRTDPIRLLTFLKSQAVLYRTTGELDGAIAVCREALKLAAQSDPSGRIVPMEDVPSIGALRNELCRSMLEQKKYDEVVELLNNVDSSDVAQQVESLHLCGLAHKALEHDSAADACFLSGLSQAENHLETQKEWPARFRALLGETAMRRGDFDQARSLLNEAVAVLSRTVGDDDAWTREAVESQKQLDAETHNGRAVIATEAIQSGAPMGSPPATVDMAR
ncbi:MAG: tetratricopeptide repeat protein [Pirellulales bacterium]